MSPATALRAWQLFLAAHVEQPVQALFGGRDAGDQTIVDRDRAGDDLAQRHLTDELVGQGLEHVCQRLSSGIGGHLDLLGAGDHRHRSIGRAGPDLADEIGQPVDPDTGERRPDEHGKLETVEHLVGQRAFQLHGARHVAGQVTLELVVVARDDLFDELVVNAVFFVGDVTGQWRGVMAAVAVVLECLVRQHVGDPVQRLLFAQWQLEGYKSVAPLRPQSGQHVVEVGALLVVFVDEHETGNVAGNASLPCQFGPDLDAVDGADHQNGQVGDAECGHLLADEIGVARGVEQVDLVRVAVGGLPLERGDPQGQRHPALDFFGIGARHRGAVFNSSDTCGDASAVQQRLDERGLAASTVADQHHIADALCWDDVQRLDPHSQV